MSDLKSFGEKVEDYFKYKHFNEGIISSFLEVKEEFAKLKIITKIQELHYVICLNLATQKIDPFSSGKNKILFSLCVPNTDNNSRMLSSNWDFFQKNDVKIYFFNFFSPSGKFFWVINPFLHEKWFGSKNIAKTIKNFGSDIGFI
jgi:hypothetical protein